MTLDAPEPRGLRASAILLWQAIVVGVGAIVSWSLGRGWASAFGLVLGASLLHLSMRLTEMTLRLGLRRDRHPLFAGSLFVAKLLLLLGIGAIGLATDWIDPIALAAGAATLPMAIVLDTCYVAWAKSPAGP